MPLVNCKIDLELTWHRVCIISSENAAGGQVVSFMITNTKLYVPVVTLSTKDNNNLTKQLNDGFKRTIYWNHNVSKPFPETPHKKLVLLDLLETFMINQLMIQLENMMKLERSQMEKEIITRLDVY